MSTLHNLGETKKKDYILIVVLPPMHMVGSILQNNYAFLFYLPLEKFCNWTVCCLL